MVKTLVTVILTLHHNLLVLLLQMEEVLQFLISEQMNKDQYLLEIERLILALMSFITAGIMVRISELHTMSSYSIQDILLILPKEDFLSVEVMETQQT